MPLQKLKICLNKSQCLYALITCNNVCNWVTLSFNSPSQFFQIFICIQNKHNLKKIQRQLFELKVSKSKKTFFSKLHRPKTERNIIENWKFCSMKLGQNFVKYFVRYLGNGVSTKNAFEINWPLGHKLRPCKSYLRIISSFYCPAAIFNQKHSSVQS